MSRKQNSTIKSNATVEKTFKETRKYEIAVLESVIATIRPIMPTLSERVESGYKQTGQTFDVGEYSYFDWSGLYFGDEGCVSGPFVDGKGECNGRDLYLICDDPDHPENVGRFVLIEYSGRYYPNDGPKASWKSKVTFLSYDEALRDTDLALILEFLEKVLHRRIKPQRKKTCISPPKQAKRIQALVTLLV